MSRRPKRKPNPPKQTKTQKRKKHEDGVIRAAKSASGFGGVCGKGLRQPNPNRFQSKAVRPNNLPSTPAEEPYVPQLGVEFDEEGNRF